MKDEKAGMAVMQKLEESRPLTYAEAQVKVSENARWVERIKALGFTSEQFELYKRVMPAGVPLVEAYAFLTRVRDTGLDPMQGQIYLAKNHNYETGRDDYTIIIGINGHRIIAERTGRYSPGKETTFEYADGKLKSATVYVKVYHQPSNTWNEVSGTAFFAEYAQYYYPTGSGERVLTSSWDKMGHNQTEKCAEVKALRRAFPDQMAGLYVEEEMQQVNSANKHGAAAIAAGEAVTAKAEAMAAPKILNGRRLDPSSREVGS